MTIRLAFILGIFLSGCGTLYKAPGIYSHIDFKAYTNAYLEYKDQHLGRRTANYPIDISYAHFDADDDAVGECERYLTKFHTRHIRIDYTYWQNSTDDQRLNLIFHELAHCDLNCPHQEEVTGIMNSILINKFKDEYVEQMFLKECR